MARTVSRYEKKRSVSRQSAVLGFALAALAINTGIDDEIMHVGKAIGSVVGSVAEGLDANYRESKQNSMMTVQVAPESTVPPQRAPLAEQPITALPPEVAPPVVDASIPNDCLGGTYDGWYFDPNALATIDTVNYRTEEKEFLKNALIAICENKRAGSLDNPIVTLGQASLESGNGQDTLSGPDCNNLLGHKARKNDKMKKTVWTKEDYGNGLVSVKQEFSCYESPKASIFAHTDMLDRLDHYQATIDCRADTQAVINDMQNYVDPVTCKIVKQQGEEGVLSYATARNYEKALNGRIDYIKAEQIIYRP